MAISNLADFTIRAGKSSSSVQGGFEAIYDQTVNDVLGGTGKETFEAVNYLKKVNPGQYKPENGAQYPRTPFGNSLLQIAQLIKAGVGLEVAFTDTPGLNWDTHVNEGNARGQLGNLLQQFGNAIAALHTDLGQRMDDVVILTMSEFGRTARENGNRGTDHGTPTRCSFWEQCSRREGLWSVARTEERSAQRRSRPRANNGLPRRLR